MYNLKMTRIGQINNQFNITNQFSIENTNQLSQDFSVVYLTLKDGRDPGDKDLVSKISPGWSGLYIVVQGKLVFSFYGSEKTDRYTVYENEHIFIESDEQYDIEGNGRVLLVTMPAYKDEMFTKVPKPN